MLGHNFCSTVCVIICLINDTLWIPFTYLFTSDCTTSHHSAWVRDYNAQDDVIVVKLLCVSVGEGFIRGQLSKLHDACVTSLHEALSFTQILTKGSLIWTLKWLLCQCIELQYISSVIRLRFMANKQAAGSDGEIHQARCIVCVVHNWYKQLFLPAQHKAVYDTQCLWRLII